MEYLLRCNIDLNVAKIFLEGDTAAFYIFQCILNFLKDLIWIEAHTFSKHDVLGGIDFVFPCSRICPSRVKASHLISLSTPMPSLPV